MNLIEQLGGYKYAKQTLINAKNSNDIDPVVFIDGQEVLIDCICDALLQHRRENNIFEYGDKIIDSLMGNSVIVFLEFHENIGDGYIKSFVRHATDAEIKAGHRL